MKHGESANCGYDYAENNGRAFCPHCMQRLDEAPEGFALGDIVRHTTKALKSLYGNGGRGAPIDGRIVGCAGTFPIVQWSDGHVCAIAAGALQMKKRRAA